MRYTSEAKSQVPAKPVEGLAEEINKLVASANRSLQIAENRYRRAGVLLVEAQTRIEAGQSERFRTFDYFIERALTIKRTRAYQIIAAAEMKMSVKAIWRSYMMRTPSQKRREMEFQKRLRQNRDPANLLERDREYWAEIDRRRWSATEREPLFEEGDGEE